jgi:hypothetical protein
MHPGDVSDQQQDHKKDVTIPCKSRLKMSICSNKKQFLHLFNIFASLCFAIRNSIVD